MPPKKKPQKKKKKGTEEESKDYNLDKMTIDELKNYAHMLENGIEEMRKHSSFYQKAETELMFLYENRQKELAKQDELLLEKDMEMEALRSKVEQTILEKSYPPIYAEYASLEHEHILNSRTSEQLDNLANQNEKEKLEMRDTLRNKERELEVLSKRIQMAKIEATDSAYSKLQETAEYEKELVDKCTKEFSQMITETNLEFSLTLKSIESEALEAKRIAEQQFRNACLSYKNKLQEYYKNVTRSDLDSIKELKQRITELEKDIAKNTLRLKEIQKQNLELKAKTPRFTETKVTDKVKNYKSLKNVSMNIYKTKRIAKISDENKRLEEEIQKVENECNNLRDQFTLTLCKVRDCASLKAVILEKKLDQLLTSKEGSDDHSNLAKSGILSTRAVQEYCDLSKSKLL